MMLDREHSLTAEEVDKIEGRLRNLSLSLLPQLVERDLPKLINEVRTLHSILFMNNFVQSFNNGVNTDGTAEETETDSVQGQDQESTGTSQAGERDRTSSEDAAGQPDESVRDSAAARKPSRVHQGSTANKKRNRRRRKGHK